MAVNDYEDTVRNVNAPCDECGATGEYKASASRGGETRYFCHNDERSCYNKRRGRYFAPPANPYKGIRKVRKAQWVYDCPLCGTSTAPATDLFGGCEAKLAHIRGPEHTAATLNAMGQAFSDTLTTFGNALVRAVKPITDFVESVTAAPPNIPHDPSLRGDKRKWGGR